MPLLPASWQPYAKSITPALLTVLAVVVQWVATGEFDRAELATTLTGLLAALVSNRVPNGADETVLDGDPPDDDGMTTLGRRVEDDGIDTTADNVGRGPAGRGPDA